MTADSRPSDASPLPTRLLGPVLAWLLLAATATASAQEVVPYASGGVGLNSQEELIARQGEFSLKLVFAEKRTGSYLANVAVTIADTAGETLIDAVADGPWFYARLPAGAYRVTATFAGVAQSVEVQVPASGLTEQYLRWEPAVEAR